MSTPVHHGANTFCFPHEPETTLNSKRSKGIWRLQLGAGNLPEKLAVIGGNQTATKLVVTN